MMRVKCIAEYFVEKERLGQFAHYFENYFHYREYIPFGTMRSLVRQHARRSKVTFDLYVLSEKHPPMSVSQNRNSNQYDSYLIQNSRYMLTPCRGRKPINKKHYDRMMNRKTERVFLSSTILMDLITEQEYYELEKAKETA